MTELQLISFILLWAVILIEGVLLFLLYREIGLSISARQSAFTGLRAGSQAPSLVAKDASGKELSLEVLLTAEYNLFIFGSFSCSPCRALLLDQSLPQLLKTISYQTYFVAPSDGLGDKAFAEVSDPLRDTLPIITVEEAFYRDYLIKATPFAYILDRTGIIRVSTPIYGVQHLVQVCNQAKAVKFRTDNLQQTVLVKDVMSG